MMILSLHTRRRYRALWTMEEIRPYVVEFAVGGLSLDQLLLKYGRAVRAPRGEKGPDDKPLMVFTWR